MNGRTLIFRRLLSPLTFCLTVCKDTQRLGGSSQKTTQRRVSASLPRRHEKLGYQLLPAELPEVAPPEFALITMWLLRAVRRRLAALLTFSEPQERIQTFFARNCGFVAMSRNDDGLFRQGQQLVVD